MSSPSPLLRTISLLLRMPAYGVGCGIRKAAARYPNFRQWIIDLETSKTPNITEFRDAKLSSSTINCAASEASHGAVGTETLPSTEELLQTATHFYGKIIVYSVAGGIFFMRSLGLSKLTESKRRLEESKAFTERSEELYEELDELSEELDELRRNGRALEDKMGRSELNQQSSGN